MALADFLLVPIVTIAILYAVGRLLDKCHIFRTILCGRK